MTWLDTIGKLAGEIGAVGSLLLKQPPKLEELSLDKLESWLANIDKDFDEGLALRGVSFERSNNESLGFVKDNPADFIVFNPSPLDASGAVSIHNETNPKDLTPHQKAFIQVIEEGLKRTDGGTVLIDMATLAPDGQYFCDQVQGSDGRAQLGTSVIEQVARLVNENAKGKKVVIRLLVGEDSASTRPDKDLGWESLRKRYEDIFWANPGGVNNPPDPADPHHRVIPDGAKAYTSWFHGDVTLYVGYYVPDFLISPTDDDIQGVKDFFNRILKSELVSFGRMFGDFLGKLDADALVNQVVKTHPPAITWNHAKVLAVNGSTLMTGGINYWDVYAHTREHRICDTAAKIKGDAAVAAHRWADYFWGYLQHQTKSDKTSLWRCANLSANTDGQRPTWSQPASVPDSKAFKNSVPNKQSQTLSVARLGDWYGDKMKKLRYPVQVIDAVRDILLQAAWQYHYPTGRGAAGLKFVTSYMALTDDTLVSLTGRQQFQALGINPMAWASRYIRAQAIAKANHQVVICQQMLVDTLVDRNASYKVLPDSVNAQVNKLDPTTKREPWDGSIWPFDILIALAQALGNMQRSKSPDPRHPAYEPDSKGIYILLTTNKASGGEDGWEDLTPIKAFLQRLRTIMQVLPVGLGGIDASEQAVDDVIKNFVHFRRTGTSSDAKDRTLYTHSKIVCVDRKVMYVGSDNAYPNYNEEHGVWIEDSKTIDAWAGGFFAKFWKACREPDDA